MMKSISTLFVLSLFLVACTNAPTESSETKAKDEPATMKDVETPADQPADPETLDVDPEATPEPQPEAPAAKSYDPTPKAAGWPTPDVVKVQHILIAVQGARQAKPTALPSAAARQQAEEICDRIRAGGDINQLMREFSGDPGPGIYTMFMKTNVPGAYPRSGMAPAFGDVSYQLDVGECAITEYSAARSPFGFHIIKRLE